MNEYEWKRELALWMIKHKYKNIGVEKRKYVVENWDT